MRTANGPTGGRNGDETAGVAARTLVLDFDGLRAPSSDSADSESGAAVTGARCSARKA